MADLLWWLQQSARDHVRKTGALQPNGNFQWQYP